MSVGMHMTMWRPEDNFVKSAIAILGITQLYY